MNYHFDWLVVVQNAPLILGALGMTFKVSIAAEFVALVLGLFVALARLQTPRLINAPAVAFIEIFRSVPLLVLLIWIYYGLPIIADIDITPFVAGVTGLGLLYGANLAEVFRSGLQAIPRGQSEAAITIGLTRFQTALLVTIPQAVRIVTPALANSYVGMMKDATLVSVVGLAEVMRTAQTVVAESFRPFEVYTFVAFIYLVLTILLGRIVDFLEKRRL
jgi:His/Glu/Gln/Arg/opine family amino acid ABC transporter permease subunit